MHVHARACLREDVDQRAVGLLEVWIESELRRSAVRNERMDHLLYILTQHLGICHRLTPGGGRGWRERVKGGGESQQLCIVASSTTSPVHIPVHVHVHGHVKACRCICPCPCEGVQMYLSMPMW